MRLYAIGDLHLSFKPNRAALEALEPHPDDGLILCGDVGEKREHLALAFETAKSCFEHVFWVPGNHELYTMPGDERAAEEREGRGEDKYMECVEIARSHGVHTPEDPWVRWEGEGGPAIIALTFTLYDYSFRPPHISRENALAWAKEEGIEATDEALLHPDPFPSKDAWCHSLIAKFERRLEAAQAEGLPLIIVNHWPLRQDLVEIRQVPRFSLWCGSTLTEDWHRRFNAKVVVTGHLHVRRTDWRDGVRFEECSFGYPRQWSDAKGVGVDVNGLLREVLPGPKREETGGRTVWRRYG
ncbi:transposase [Aulographum hederae CBS 113979]|uniref:Transposase n=1 Tax=Aulographum hederae CBS 113979 TaxID=1176131 RepID=A0A6G1H872_9PEZI|nr:transposase [Aulographum hederae CBS 113979]